MVDPCFETSRGLLSCCFESESSYFEIAFSQTARATLPGFRVSNLFQTLSTNPIVYPVALGSIPLKKANLKDYATYSLNRFASAKYKRSLSCKKIVPPVSAT